MAELEGRTFLVTGASSGIGRETVRALARRGGRVFFTCRTEPKARAAIDELGSNGTAGELEYLQLDLGDLESVRACAEAFLATGEPLHALVNNAGLAGKRGMTPSGFELAFGTNHVGPFLLTSLLIERLRESAPARVVNVASEAHQRVRGIDFEAVRKPTKSISGMPEYAVSKLANVLHAVELARRLEGTGVTSYALHPGVIASDIWRQVPWPVRPLIKLRMRSPQDGAGTPVYCATSPEVAGESGRYYEDARPKRAGRAVTPELASELWERTAGWVSPSS
jgi:NAD(P)-dependent dehydrogenase (short-subunit alcohol dehydrogenase family)